MQRFRSRLTAVVLGATISTLLVGCASIDQHIAKERAQHLVDATRSSGLAPELTVDIAESLYGEDAPSVCGVLENDPVAVASWARVRLAGMPKAQLDDLASYDRLVVASYCDDLMDRYNQLLGDLHYDG